MRKEEERTPFLVYLGEDKKWRVTADTFQFILERKTTPKKEGGKSSYVVEGYYTNLAHLLESLFHKKLRESDVKTLKGIEKQVKLLREEISRYARVVIK